MTLSLVLFLFIFSLLHGDPTINHDHQNLLNQAHVLFHKERYHRALEYYKAYVKQYPKHSAGLFGVATCLFKLHRYKEALKIYQLVSLIAPTSCGAWYNIGYCARLLGDHRTAIDAYQQTLALKPEHENAHFGLSKSYLAIGDFKHGWKEFEWRYGDVTLFKQHKIDIATLQGKKVLLRSEWGLGDIIQFIRYAKILKDVGAIVYLETVPALIPILSSCPFIDRIFAINSKIPIVDVYIPLLSIPYLCNTQLDTIPTPIPYIYADPTLLTYWSTKLNHDDTIKIGICWHAKPIFIEDYVYTRRSIPLALLAPLSQLPHVKLYSLQKVHGVEELTTIPDTMYIHDFGQELDTEHGCLMDTAAIMQQLDMVISVDTAIVHLAGALGIPTWVLLPYNAEWRWLQERTDSPWYPKNMRLFRQKTPGNWHTVIEEVCAELIRSNYKIGKQNGELV